MSRIPRRIEWVRIGTGTYVARIDGKLTSWRAARNDNEPSGSDLAWTLAPNESDYPVKESWALKDLTRWLTEYLERRRGAVVSRIPSYQRPGVCVHYVYTNGPVPAGTCGTVEGWHAVKYAASIRWSDDTISVHTPDEYEVTTAKRD